MSLQYGNVFFVRVIHMADGHPCQAKTALKPTESAPGSVPIRRTATSASAPPVPITRRSDTSSTVSHPIPEDSENGEKRFAKTLRLTSDQLVCCLSTELTV